MSNRFYLQRTVFQDVQRDGTEVEKSFGYRMYDGYGGQTYDNTLTKDQILMTDEDLLRFVKNGWNGIAGKMIDFLRDDKTGIYIDNDWRNWEWVKKVLDIPD